MYKFKRMTHILPEDSAIAAVTDTSDVLPRTHEEKTNPELLNGRYEITNYSLG